MKFLQVHRFWSAWKFFARKVGSFQSRLFLVLFYFVVVAPFALFVRISRDPLRIKMIGRSNWIDRQTPSDDLNEARRQF